MIPPLRAIFRRSMKAAMEPAYPPNGLSLGLLKVANFWLAWACTRTPHAVAAVLRDTAPETVSGATELPQMPIPERFFSHII